jgi:GT2 family glycosyltransferase
VTLTRTAVITIVSGRDEHLHRQRLAMVGDPPDLHVVVAMGAEPYLPPVDGGPEVSTVHVEVAPGGLPLAAARVAGARRAIEAGADVLIFLDVDCIPGPALTSGYRRAVVAEPRPALLCGPVSYLPPPPLNGYPIRRLAQLAAPHPGRPVPATGEIMAETRFELFWSLSFAVGCGTWTDVGGFDEGYVGYGAEDTDFALRAAALGATLHWVGDAPAYHQHHPPSREDPQRVPEMVRNAERFFYRHGSWPMGDWLSDLARRGLITFDPVAGTCRVVPGG